MASATVQVLIMEDSNASGSEVAAFLDTGICRLEDSNAVFIDPVRVLNRSYTRFRVSPSAYYCRAFESKSPPETSISSNSRKRKRKEKKPQALNDREQVADRRHQEVRPFLLKAHESLVGATEVLEVMSNLRGGFGSSTSSPPGLQLAQVWQAPLCEIRLNFHTRDIAGEDGGSPITQCHEQRVLPVFNNLVVNETGDDVEAQVLNSRYILPPNSSFYMVCRLTDYICLETATYYCFFFGGG